MRAKERGRPWLGLAALLALGLPAFSWSQGMFYKEIRKDGRIYVFNNADEAERFEKSGELGRAITRIGAGPAGETVVADSEQALQLFFFKHGLAERVDLPKPPTQKIEWRDGKTRITTDDAYLEISNRIQVRFTHELPDGSVQLPGTPAPGEDRGSFRIRRAKFKLEGWFYRPWLTYETQLNWPAVTGSNPGAFLEDTVIDWDLSRGKNRFRLRFGQYKVPFGHQELTSSGSQGFVDRAEVSNQYARGRDLGFTVWGQIDSKVEWRFGVFNGNGLTRSANDNDAFQYNARLVWQPGGAVNLNQRAWVSGALYSEGDFESTDRPLYALAVNFESNDFHRTTPGNDLKDRVFGFDGIFKYKGVFATAEGYLRERTPESGPRFDSNGWFGQIHYLFARRKWELAFRYGTFDPSDLVGNNHRREIRGAVSYYERRHGLKIQADFGRLEDEAGNSGRGVRNLEFRLQTQMVF